MLGGERLKCAVCSFLPMLRAQRRGDRARGTSQEQQCWVRSGLRGEGVWQ